MITDPVVLGIVAAFGLMIGSFLNVCIIRFSRDPENPSDPAAKLPATVVNTRSMCPHCANIIAWYDNIPILSWLFLRAKCRHCGAPISSQYPLIEGAVGILWLVACWWYGISATGVAAGVFWTILLGIMVTDAKHYIIPDEFTQGGLAFGLLLSIRNGPWGLGDAAIGAAVGFYLLYGVAIAAEKVFGEEAMGGGDVKMMAMVGAFLGWQGVLLTIFGGALLALLAFLPLSLWVLFPRSSKGRTEIPYGVFLALAAALVFVGGGTIVQWYVEFLRAA